MLSLVNRNTGHVYDFIQSRDDSRFSATSEFFKLGYFHGDVDQWLQNLLHIKKRQFFFKKLGKRKSYNFFYNALKSNALAKHYYMFFCSY